MTSESFRLFIYCFAAVFITVITGCSQQPQSDGYAPVKYDESADLIEDRNRELSKAPTQDEIFDARLKYELAQAEAGARTIAELERKDKDIKAKIDVANILDSLQKETPQKKTAGEQSRQLLSEKKYAEAVEAAMLVPQSAARDILLADIIRIQLGQQFRQSIQTKEQKAETLKSIIRTSGKVSDPQMRAELLNSICVACFSDGSGGVADGQPAEQFRELLIFCLKEAAVSMRQNNGTAVNEFDKASFFCNTAQRLINLGEMKTAEDCCRDAEKAAGYISNPFEASTALLNVAELYLLAGKAEKAAEVLKSEKKIKIPESVSEDIPNSSAAVIKQRRNHTWGHLAVLQVWTLPPEEVKNTITDMDAGTERDNAVSEVIEMLLLSDTPQKAEDWLDEISDTTLKNKLTEKVKSTVSGK